MTTPPRIIRITTAPVSLKVLLNGQVNFLQRHNFHVLAVSADGKEVVDIVSQQVPHQVIPMTRAITPFQDLKCLIQLVRLIRSFKPHIVHTHTPKAGLLGMMAAFWCRVPIRMHTIAGLPLMEASGVKRRILKLTERITFFCAHRLYPNSFGLLDFIRKEFKVPSELINSPINPSSDHSKFKVIGNGSSNGIDTSYFSRTSELEQEAFQLRLKWRIPQESLVFGFVGRLVRDKGIVELVDAFRQIADTIEARLLLVGDFEHGLDPLPEATLDFLENDPRVIVPGFQQDVRPWLMMMDVFTFPSYREGFPNSVMQACSLEIPCIVSDINGCNEIIENQVNGIIVPAKESSSLLNAMKLLANNAELRTTFAQKSRTHLVANFDQNYLWNQLLEEYRVLLKLKCTDE
ncbi:MAG: glycosyltransferase family 4 protein [Bacteroidetes bacterium]|nr:glycosyltransferase family 4 protein [Bacteroidota bacterium]